MQERVHMTLMWLLFCFAGCDIPIELDPEQTAPVPVIEAVVTDVPGQNFVHISETVGFYHAGDIPVITDAQVIIFEGLNIYQFAPYDGADPDSLGYYLPPPTFIGKPGRTYTASIIIDGVEFRATETMVSRSEIDSLAVTIDITESLAPEEEGRFYEVLVFAEEPPETKDFYLFKFYRNDILERAFDDDIYVVDDIFLAANINGVPVPFYFAEGDTARVDMYNLTQSAFIYYLDLQIAISNDGGLFSPPPANPRSNFSEFTPGFFMVASVSQNSIIVK